MILQFLTTTMAGDSCGCHNMNYSVSLSSHKLCKTMQECRRGTKPFISSLLFHFDGQEIQTWMGILTEREHEERDSVGEHKQRWHCGLGSHCGL